MLCYLIGVVHRWFNQQLPTALYHDEIVQYARKGVSERNDAPFLDFDNWRSIIPIADVPYGRPVKVIA